jgi:hypothetical protein
MPRDPFVMLVGRRKTTYATPPLAPETELGVVHANFGDNPELRRLLAESTLEQPLELNARQKLALFYGHGVTNSELDNMADGELNFAFCLARGVTEANVLAAGLLGADLKRLGAAHPNDLRKMQIDALTLAQEPAFCQSLVEVFDCGQLRSAFLATAADAVCLAGEPAAYHIGATPTLLLKACEGHSAEAVAVIQQIGAGMLDGVPADVLVDAKLNSDLLLGAGVKLNTILNGCSPTAIELQQLGFKLF